MNLYIGNLPPNCTDDTLRTLFEPYGTIVTLKALRDKGIGFVQYADAAAAASAIAAMNNVEVDGKVLLVKLADRNAGPKHAGKGGAAAPKVHVPRAPAPVDPNATDNLYVNNIPLTWSEADLNMLFGTYGPVVSSVVLKQKGSGQSKGAALVRFPDGATASTVVAALNGSMVEGATSPLEVRYADREQGAKARKAGGPGPAPGAYTQPPRYDPYQRAPPPARPAPRPAAVPAYRAPPPAPAPVYQPPAPAAAAAVIPNLAGGVPEDGTNLHISGLEPHLTDVNLYQAFSGFGAISSVAVMGPPGNNKGFGFVQFMYAVEAQRAMAAVNGLQIGSRVWSVTPHKKKSA